MKTKIELKALRLSRSSVLRMGLVTSLGVILASGRFIGTSHPFGLALTCAVTGISDTASAAIGCVIGSFTMPRGLTHAALTLGVFALRLIFGYFLSTGEGQAAEEKALPRGKTENYITYALRRAAVASKKSFAESVLFRMAVSAAASAVYGALRCADADYSVRYVGYALAGLLASPVFTYLYHGASEVREAGKSSVVREAGLLSVAVSAVMSLRSFWGGFDLSVPAAFVITVLVTRGRGMLAGALYGIVCGLTLEPLISPIYVLTAFVFGSLRKTSPAVGVTAACTVSCVWSVYAAGLSAMNYTVPALIITSAVTAPLVSSGILPSVAEGKRHVSAHKDSFGDVMLRRETVKRMKALSDCMKELSGVLHRLSDRLTSPDVETLCELCEKSFEESCRECSMQSACFGRESSMTSSLQAKMTMSLKRDGRVSAAAVPPVMASRCYSMGQIIDRMNAGYARLVSEAKLYDRTSVVAEDYGIISDMLRDTSESDMGEFGMDEPLTARLRRALEGRFRTSRITVYGGRVKRVVAFGVDVSAGTRGSDDIRKMFEGACGFALSSPEFELDGPSVNMIMRSCPAFTVTSGRASVSASEIRGKRETETHEDSFDVTEAFRSRHSRTSKRSEPCGDSISSFLTDDGRFFMLISDGMGSGSEASLTSGVCAVFIEKLLRAGATMDTSLKMLNSMMRSRGCEVSATVDLMELDLMNGGTRFVKSGAAPSFVLRGGRLFRLQSKTVPIGIVRALDAELIKFECERGDVIVMLSDGIARSFEDCPWLYDLLCDHRLLSEEATQIARRIISCAIENGAGDDITAGVVKVE